MIDVKQAVKAAKEYAAKILDGIDPAELLLEEVKPGERFWDITLSFKSRMRGDPPPRGLLESFELLRRYAENREFKSFHVNNQTGEVEGMFNVQAA